jgi:6-phosphogluconolactonase (cycloisomerase 2 family)
MEGTRRRRLTAAILTSGLALSFLGVTASNGAAATAEGAVYVLTNRTADSGGNAVLVFPRASDGTLGDPQRFRTGGDGSGSGLGSQGSLTLRGDRLFSVNAGSDEITSFEVSEDGLTLTKIRTRSSNGDMPISLTVSGSYLYVLNAGGDGEITGFVGARTGKLRPIRASSRPLSGSGVGPAQVSFVHKGDQLAVTEKNTNLIDVYDLDRDTGLATGPTTTPSEGQTPFGFDHRRDRMIVSEAAGGARGASSVSSYRLEPGNAAEPVTEALETDQSSACWLVLARHTRYGYVANTGSANITGLRLHKDDSVSLLDPSGVTATTGAAPADMAVSPGSGYLYVLAGGAHEIDGFRIADHGGLSSVGDAPSVPKSAVGLAAS